MARILAPSVEQFSSDFAGDETFSHAPAPGGAFIYPEGFPVGELLGIGILGLILVENPLLVPAAAPMARRIAPSLFGR